MSESNQVVAILPVKRLDDAKQRLSPSVSPGARRALAEAMYRDVLNALRHTRGVDQVIVVTADRAASQVAAGDDAIVLQDAGTSHSEAAYIGLEWAAGHGARRALLLPLDCPLLNPAELDELIELPVVENSVLIVPDRHGEGTNALLLTPPQAFTPSFGEGSRERHIALAQAQGATPQIVEVPTLALDIDTPEDLDVLRQTLQDTRGRAAHTRGMLAQLQRSSL